MQGPAFPPICGGASTHAERRSALQSSAMPPMVGAPWLNQTTPYPSAFMAPPAWPMYMPNNLPEPQAAQSSMQVEREELGMQHQELEAR